MSPKAALERIIEVVGGYTLLAAELGIDRNAIYAWKGLVPEKQLKPILKVARRQHRKLKRLPTMRELRPDLYPKPRGAGRGKPSGEKRGKKKIICKTKSKEGGGGTAEGQPEGGN